MELSVVEYIEPHRVPDGIWGEAYERVGALKRSRLKQTIAWNSAVVGPPDNGVMSRKVLRQGGEHMVASAPCDRTLVLVGNSFVDPTAFLAAAVFPALVGVREVVVLREAGPVSCSDAFLTGLELAGLENFGECGGTDLLGAIHLTARMPGEGAVLVLGACSPQVEKALCETDLPVHRVGRPGGVGTVHVFVDDRVQWDWECLAWAFPGATYALAGCGAGETVRALPQGVAGHEIEEAELWSRKCDLFLHPAPMHPEVFPAPLCLGPGQEGVWGWAQLYSEMFRHPTLRLSS